MFASWFLHRNNRPPVPSQIQIDSISCNLTLIQCVQTRSWISTLFDQKKGCESCSNPGLASSLQPGFSMVPLRPSFYSAALVRCFPAGPPALTMTGRTSNGFASVGAGAMSFGSAHRMGGCLVRAAQSTWGSLKSLRGSIGLKIYRNTQHEDEFRMIKVWKNTLGVCKDVEICSDDLWHWHTLTVTEGFTMR